MVSLGLENWRDLLPQNADSFVWRAGETPLSDLKILPITWILYLITIFSLWAFLKNRQPFEIKGIAAIHNLFICIWSLVMFIGIMYEVIFKLKNEGVEGLYCAKDPQSKGSFGYWLYMYYISKFFELFDTVIIVLRKKPLIFLHVYHHIIVVLMVWLWLEYNIVWSSLGMAFNTFVHVLMYYFFYATVVGKFIWWKKYITTIQIIQFMSSFLLAIPYVYYTVGYDDAQGNFQAQCTGWNAFLFSCFCNFSFLLLFMDFYRKTYNGPKDGSKTQKKKE